MKNLLGTTMAVLALMAASGTAQFTRAEEKAAGRDETAKADQAKVHPYLGVAVSPLHPAFWAHLRDVLEDKQGILVTQVASDSPAEKAGIKTHDILMTYGEQKLYSPHQLHALVQADKIGREATISIVREGKTLDVKVTLTGRAEPTPAPVQPRRKESQGEEQPAWTSFDSLNLQSLGNGRFKVEIGYETKDGKMEHRAFEGTKEEIRQDIVAQKNLPENERADLLRALALPEGDPAAGVPEIYVSPDGRVFLEIPNLNKS